MVVVGVAVAAVVVVEDSTEDGVFWLLRVEVNWEFISANYFLVSSNIYILGWISSTVDVDVVSGLVTAFYSILVF